VLGLGLISGPCSLRSSLVSAGSGWTGSAPVVFLNFGLERLLFFPSSLFASLLCPYCLRFLRDLLLYFINLLVANVGFGSWSFWGLTVRVYADVTYLRNASSSGW